MQKNPDLERLEIALVQLGFALEQQEIQAEAERTRHDEVRKTLLKKIEALEVLLQGALAGGAPRGETVSATDVQEGK